VVGSAVNDDRFAVYAQNVNLYLAPTADGRDTWLSLMRTVGCESRAFVMSANQCLQQKDLPGWITGKKSAQEHTSSTTNGGTSVPYRRLRRQSIVTKTADNHEITWPLPDTANAVSLEQHVNGDGHPPARRPSIAAKTFENHDVVISSPLAKSKPAHVQPEPQTSSTSTIREESSSNDNDFVSRGGSCVIGPMGQVIVAPVWEKTDELLMATVDFEDCERGRLDFDAAGSYSRSDAFKLTVEGLDLTPPC
jgi:nitrilase